ncbi:spinster family MFS transporter [Halopseudomonas aestusnigri]|uniref:Sugar phosphate permease n=1 Tax=Halopseudomonas aestusnigri TaxID=857252 RepID=A0AAQ1JPP5_9GAMM|nr:MFS transporter [Halopseudomonas aestusnigri]OWL89206.1 arabinose ABC transporter permease [Halopseudomonas aestusnigri]SEG05248.1 Sugar phosphate permease [Halopseudomonas aestusnigri]
MNAPPRTSVPHAPVVTWRTHYALFMLAIIYIFNYIDRLVVSILIEPIKLEFGVSDTLIGLLSGVAFALFYTVFGLPFSRLADRFGRKPVVALACIAWSVMTMLCGLAGSFAVLLLCRIGVAVGEAGGSAPSVAMVSDLYPPKQRTRALAVLMMGPAVGALVGLGVGGWVAETWGWRWAFIATGAPGVLLGLLLAFTVREPAKPADTSAQNSNDSFWRTISSLLATPSYLLIIVGGSLAAIAGYAIATWNPSFLIRSHGLSLKEAGLLMGLGGGVISVCGTLACGWFTDRMVARSPAWQLGAALFGSLLSIPFCLAFYLWPAGTAFQVGSVAVPTAGLFYIGFAFFGMWWSVPCFGAMSHLFPPSRLAQGTAILFMGITLFGVGLGPLVVGVLSDLFSHVAGTEALRYSLASTVSLLALSCLCLALAIPRYVRQITTTKVN